MKITDISRYCANFNAAKDFLHARQIIRHDVPQCDACDRLMTEVKCGRGEELMWRCPTHKANKMSLHNGSFLQNQKISLPDFMLIYLWAHKIPVTTTEELVGISRPTAIQWYAYLRDIWSHHLVMHPIQLGGLYHIVQIDESLMAKQRNNQGQLVPKRWVFGGIDTTTNYGFLTFIPDRSAATLIPIIQQFILLGSTIHSGQWAGYNRIPNIPVVPPYTHETVNHTLHFVDPNTHAHTNAVECMWKNCKRRFKAMLGVHSTMLPSHIDEFMWRQQYGRTHVDAFDNILLHLSQWYVTP